MKVFKRLKYFIPMSIFMALLLAGITVKADTGTVNATKLNFREGPSIISRRIGQIPNRAVVTIVDTSNASWFKITYNGQSGYVSSDYIIKNAVNNYGTGTVNATTLHVRKGPSLTDDIISKIYKNQKVNVLSKEGNWYKINLDGKDCYVYSEYIDLDNKPKTNNENKVYEVTCNKLNMRAAASTGSNIVGTISRGTKVTLLEVHDKWYYVQTSNGAKAYIHSDYVKLSTSTGASRGEEKEIAVPAAANLTKADELIQYAKSFLGVKYVYGGASPSGFDCSGFTSYVFKKFGYKLNRVSSDQALNGVAVSKSQLQKGDLVLFSSSRGSSKIGHVGIYIGGGSFIHASSGSNSKKVVITSLSDPFYVDTYKAARRILK